MKRTDALNARHMRLYNPTYEAKKDSGKLDANTWYIIEEKADDSGFISQLKVGDIFKSQTDQQFTLKAGDVVSPITLGDPVAFVECSVSFAQDQIDTTDTSTTGGSKSSIRSGFTDVSGSINRFTKFQKNKTLEEATKAFVNQFVTVIEDTNKANGYVVKRSTDGDLLAFICYNGDATEGETQNWLIFNIVITGYEWGGALMDAIKGDLTYNKGQGEIALYSRVVGSGDQL